MRTCKFTVPQTFFFFLTYRGKNKFVMTACVGVFDMAAPRKIAFRVLWRCERSWLCSGQTLLFLAVEAEEEEEEVAG